MSPYTAIPVVAHAPALAARLREAMDAKGIGVRELATRTGINKGTISAWQRGDQQRVQVDRVRRAATVLGTTAEHLLDLPPPTQPAGDSSDQIELVQRIVLPALRQLASEAGDAGPKA